MRPIEDVFPHVLPHAPNCPRPAALLYVREAAIEFCRRTRIWRHADAFDYEGEPFVCVPPDSSLFEIEQAKFDGRRLAAAAHFDRDDESGPPQYVTQVTPNTISIVPQAIGRLWLSLFLVPSQDAKTLPDFLLDQHGKALGAGALASILLLPNQPYTNPQLAAIFDQQFQGACDRSFASHVKGQQRARLRSHARYF